MYAFFFLSSLCCCFFFFPSLLLTFVVFCDDFVMSSRINPEERHRSYRNESIILNCLLCISTYYMVEQ